MSDDPRHATAVFVQKTDKRGRDIALDLQPEIRVHFNPETLDISYSSTLQKGKRDQPAKVVSETTAKLSMELVFDTTMPGVGHADGQTRVGKDVRLETIKIIQLMDPAQVSPRKKKAKGDVPSIVAFRWVAFYFEGYLDSVKEKIELFSPEGVPLRAVVSITMTQQQRSLDPTQPAQTVSLTPGADPLTPVKSITPGRPLGDAIPGLGGSISLRDLAEQNGIENLRFPEVGELVVSVAQQRPPPDLFGINPSIARAGLELGGTAALFGDLRGAKGGGVSLTPRARLSLDLGVGTARGVGIGANGSFGISGESDLDAGVSMSADLGQDADIELGTNHEE